MPRKKLWETHNEIMFLENIGSYGPTKRDKKKCLTGYLKGCELRDDWDGLDKDVIINQAKFELGAL